MLRAGVVIPLCLWQDAAEFIARLFAGPISRSAKPLVTTTAHNTKPDGPTVLKSQGGRGQMVQSTPQLPAWQPTLDRSDEEQQSTASFMPKADETKRVTVPALSPTDSPSRSETNRYGSAQAVPPTVKPSTPRLPQQPAESTAQSESRPLTPQLAR